MRTRRSAGTEYERGKPTRVGEGGRKRPEFFDGYSRRIGKDAIDFPGMPKRIATRPTYRIYWKPNFE